MKSLGCPTTVPSMARGKRGVASGEMAALARDIRYWRETRKKAGAMPAELWDRAVALGKEHGVGATVRALGLGHATLKARVEAKTGGGASFIEVASGFSPVVSPRVPAVDDSLAVELAGSSGQRLTVRMSSLAQLEGVMPLVMQCWERQR